MSAMGCRGHNEAADHRAEDITAPRITIMSQPAKDGRGFSGSCFLRSDFDGQNGLGMDLTDAGFSDAKGLGNFAQPQVLKIIKREHLALHVRQVLQAGLDQAGHLAHGGPLPGLSGNRRR